MEDQQILDAIQTLARKHLDWDGSIEARGELSTSTRLVEDLELDSVDMTTLAVEVEDHFDISLEEEDEERIVTVGDLVNAIRRQVDGRDDQPGA